MKCKTSNTTIIISHNRLTFLSIFYKSNISHRMSFFFNLEIFHKFNLTQFTNKILNLILSWLFIFIQLQTMLFLSIFTILALCNINDFIVRPNFVNELARKI